MYVISCFIGKGNKPNLLIWHSAITHSSIFDVKLWQFYKKGLVKNKVLNQSKHHRMSKQCSKIYCVSSINIWIIECRSGCAAGSQCVTLNAVRSSAGRISIDQRRQKVDSSCLTNSEWPINRMYRWWLRGEGAFQ